ASGVQLAYARDAKKQSMLILTEAADGNVQCHTTFADLGSIFKSSANEKGKKVGLTVQKARIAFSSENDHQLSADLHLNSRLLLLPVTLHFTAQVQIDDEGNARLSNLTCQGDDIAGVLITQIIRPNLRKYDNKTMPLIAFPSPEMRLHDVRVQVQDQTVSVSAAFGK